MTRRRTCARRSGVASDEIRTQRFPWTCRAPRLAIKQVAQPLGSDALVCGAQPIARTLVRELCPFSASYFRPRRVNGFRRWSKDGSSPVSQFPYRGTAATLRHRARLAGPRRSPGPTARATRAKRHDGRAIVRTAAARRSSVWVLGVFGQTIFPGFRCLPGSVPVNSALSITTPGAEMSCSSHCACSVPTAW